MFPKFLFTVLLSFQFNSSLMKSSRTIILIRQSEKISDDYTDLSPEGQARAKCLPELFTREKLGYVPDNIYANKRSFVSARPYDTVFPLAKYLGLEIKEFKKSSSTKVKIYSKSIWIKNKRFC